VLCECGDDIEMGAGLVGFLATLSHIARLGLMTHLDSPMISSGSSGRITLEVHNAGPAVIRLTREMPVAKICVFQLVPPREATPPRARFYGRGRALGSRFGDEFGAAGDEASS
jgi:deoxycytidine triphosphate deaminase